MEFLRFGSSIPGSYWGCCAVCIIQNFKFDPDQAASIQLVNGDGGTPITHDGKAMFAGPTYRDIFWQRLRIGTFCNRDMPNHAFFAILTEGQISYNPGKAWLAVLKEAGFEFVRSVSNSVYAGNDVADSAPSGRGSNINHIFALYRNIGEGGSSDPFTPPKAWTDLPSVKTEAWQALVDQQFADVGPQALTQTQFKEDLAIWNAMPRKPFLTEEEVEAAGAPVVLGGLRSEFPQELKSVRTQRQEAKNSKVLKTAAVSSKDPFQMVACVGKDGAAA